MNDVDRLSSEARELSVEERNKLTDPIRELAPEKIDPAIDEAWRDELRVRRGKIESGEIELIAWDDVRAQLFNK